MARRKKYSEPKGNDYKQADAFDTRTQAGRAGLWHERLRMARAELKIESRAIAIREAQQFLDGSFPRKNDSYVYLNEALPAMEDVIYSTAPKLPPVQTSARQVEQEDLADTIRALLDNTLNSGLADAHDALLDILWDEMYWGIGIGKTIWFEEEKEQRYRPTGDLDYLAPHIQQAQEENQDPLNANVAEGDDDGVHIQEHAKGLELYMTGDEEEEALQKHIDLHWSRIGKTLNAHPLLRRVDPKEFLYDPDAKRWEERRWEGELCTELVSVLQKIPGIKNLNKENCPSIDEFNHEATFYGNMKEVSGYDYENTRVQVWKIHDRANDQYIILPAKSGDEIKPVLEADWPYGSIDSYGHIKMRRVPGQIHGHSTLILLEAILYELARTNAAIRKHVRRAPQAKMVGARGVLDAKGFKDLTSDAPYVGIPAEAVQGMREFKPPSVPKELLAFRETLLAEMRRLLGSDIMTQGGDTPHEISASEAQLRGGYQESRMIRRQQVTSDFLSWAARNIVMLYRDLAAEEIPVRVIGPMGVEIKRLDPASIPDDLMVKLDIYASTESRQQKDLLAAKEFVQILTQLLPPGQYDPIEVLDMLRTRFGNIPPVEKFLVRPDQMVLPGAPVSTGSAPAPEGSAGNQPQLPNLKIATPA